MVTIDFEYSTIPISAGIIACNRAYGSSGLFLTNLKQEKESQEYEAYTFEVNNKKVLFRVAKITPTKKGQFVTFWKREKDSGPIMSYDMADAVDFFVISVQNGAHYGQFIFPKNVLCQKGFVSKAGVGGKRAMRVYPPWDVVDSVQASKTQAWQLIYFVECEPVFNAAQLRSLFL